MASATNLAVAGFDRLRRWVRRSEHDRSVSYGTGRNADLLAFGCGMGGYAFRHECGSGTLVLDESRSWGTQPIWPVRRSRTPTGIMWR